MSEVPIDDVGIEMFVCSRGEAYRPKLTLRTFKGSCGSYIRIRINEKGEIAKIEHEHNACKPGCSICKAQTEKAKNLIKNGK